MPVAVRIASSCICILWFYVPASLIVASRSAGITPKSSGDPFLDSATPSTSTSTSSTAPPPADLPTVLSSLDAQLRQLYAALPARTAVVIFTGHSDPRRMAALNARKSAFETAIRSGKNPEEVLVDGAKLRWTTADARLLEEEVERAKRGLLFVGIKDAK